MAIIKAGHWTEAEILSLPWGENDSFDRKSGRAIDNAERFKDGFAAALSAFANSGGGHLFIGVANDGTLDGVPKMRAVSGGRLQDTAAWIDQLIPVLVDYPLQGHSVHHFIPDDKAPTLPPDRTVLVVNIPDSPLAPHQSVHDHRYYCRQGSQSKPASHQFVDLLRNRQQGATLTAKLVGATVGANMIAVNEASALVEAALHFQIENVSQKTTATFWDLVIEDIRGIPGTHMDGLDFRESRFIGMADEDHGPPILPGARGRATRDIRFRLRPATISVEAVRAELVAIFGEATIIYRAPSDSWHGQSAESKIRDGLDFSALAARIAGDWKARNLHLAG